MPLQSCAAVLYALGYHKDVVYEKDLQIESPYNTYKVDALPVGPVACPGKASIEAVLKPEETNYLYFVSLNDGTHFFTYDYDKHREIMEKTQSK
ncbi:conserved hypothetical protein, YceG family [Clostridium collagenovorans DSM 3089]|uniref:YceG-like family protein n=1 Tax=Clostridium collagenovorans DSM 3089 TaxID=1121306 RepID=A0A1M5SPL1_9CLOT|nr:endolytic transglycosylase MltG [Clostridium collagenovorans]SHH40337.1 conserved hypothetical protein, YceG family [Clostridium collagenovorans DSM 3089]